MARPIAAEAGSPAGTLVATTAVQALSSMATLLVPVLGTRIAHDTGLSASQLGYYIAVVYGAAIVTATVGGDAVLRWGPIRASQFALLLSALGLAMVASGSAPLMPWGAVLIGLGYGPVTPASSHMLSSSTPAHRRSLVFSIKQTGVPLGGALAGACGPLLLALLGWQGALCAVAAACVACAFAVDRLRAPHDADRRPAHPVGLLAFAGLAAQLKAVPALQTLALASFCFSILQLSLSTYLVAFLHEGLGRSLVAAGLLMSLAQASGVLGRIAWGLLADRGLGAVRVLIALAFGMSAAGWALAALQPGTAAAVVALTVLALGAGALGWNGTFLAEVARQAPAGTAGRATGAILACTYFGVVVGPPVFAVIASGAGGYRLAFAVVAGAPALAGLLLFLRRGAFAAPRTPNDPLP